MNYVAPIGYLDIKERKITGSHYTPKSLSDFVANQIFQSLKLSTKEIHVADPALGDGELLFSLCRLLNERSNYKVIADGFDIDFAAVEKAKSKINELSTVEQNIIHGDFIEYVLSQRTNTLFEQHSPVLYDAVIANPPYVRTQVLGSEKSQELSKQFNLSGRVDLYHAFILGVASLLKPDGILGIIVSNRFMTTRSGENIRRNILELFDLIHVWDFGDTQLFEAAVLPAVLLLKKKSNIRFDHRAKFTSIYSVKSSGSSIRTNNLFESINNEGVIDIDEKGLYNVQQGTLDHNGTMGGVWRLSNNYVDDWIQKVDAHTYMRFSDIGKIKVGVKTTADKVFIRDDWDSLSSNVKPELLRELSTHHISRRFKPNGDGKLTRKILYPHEVVNGVRQAVSLKQYPRTEAYLNQYRDTLEKRTYVIEAGRKWYEIWVPHDPDIWSKPKIVFRDISDEPSFWLDNEGTIVNGDCYWFISKNNDLDLLWLALAIGNSKFIEFFYDRKFNNKLYSGRRRFISQYVEQFPIPDPKSDIAREIVLLTKKIYDLLPTNSSSDYEKRLNDLVWAAYGFSTKEIPR